MARFLRWCGSRTAALAARFTGRRLAVAVAVPVAVALVAGLVAVAATASGRAADDSAASAPGPAPRTASQPGAVPGSAAAGSTAAHRGGAVQDVSLSQIIIPDLLVVAPDGLTAGQLARLASVPGVRDTIAFAGAQVTVGGQPVNVLGVSPATFRPWVPLQAASDQPLWDDLTRGDFVAGSASAKTLGLRPGGTYDLAGAATRATTYGMSADLGLPGVDLLVNPATSAKLGLVRQVAALVSAPADAIGTLRSQVAAVLGPSGKVEVLRAQPAPAPATPAAAPKASGAAPKASGGRPGSYLALFQQSAATYCPGLSWTVLAAIGQIESADGRDVGPSTAGALGPMQFLPSTWQQWGIDGFGQTGTPDIMNPYDAVPSAARMLCADGAASGSAGLRQAIFDYNHADWYVTEVLQLASQYAAAYS